MLYPVELPVHSEEIDIKSLAINQVNVVEDWERALIIINENFGLLKSSVCPCHHHTLGQDFRMKSWIESWM